MSPVLEALSPEELELRAQLEQQVKGAQYLQGTALRQLKNLRLYRSTHQNWGAYVTSLFDLTKRHADRLIFFADFTDSLQQESPSTTEGPIRSPRLNGNLNLVANESIDAAVETNHRDEPASDPPVTAPKLVLPLIYPTSETQVRPLLKLETEAERIEAWHKACETSERPIPTQRHVADVVDEIARRVNARIAEPFPHVMGELLVLESCKEPNLRALAGAYCVVKQVNDFSCTVETPLGDRQVVARNLKQPDLTLSESRSAIERVRQLARVANTSELEPAMQHSLKYFATLQKIHMTEFEEALYGLLLDSCSIQAGEEETEPVRVLTVLPSAAAPEVSGRVANGKSASE